MTSPDTSAGEYEVRVERRFAAPAPAVWETWADPAMVRQWWGPDGFTCPVAEVDLRAGGSTIVAMQAPPEYGGGESWSRWDFTDVDQPHLIRYVFRFLDPARNVVTPAVLGMPDGVPSEGEHEVRFEDLGDGSTVLTMTERGYTTEAARDMSQAGLEQCLDKMVALVSPA